MKKTNQAEARLSGMTFPACGIEVPVVVLRSSRRLRRMAISVRHQEGIVMRLPSRFPQEEAQAILLTHRAWLERQVEGLLKLGGYPGPRPIQDGDLLPYLGGWLCLRLEEGSRGGIRLEGETLSVRRAILDTGGQSEVARLLEQWYRRRAREAVGEALPRFACIMGLPVPGFRITGAKGRWGSCGRDSLNFSWRLVAVEPRLIDYVVVHELCHLRQRDHSAAFWALVAEVIPDWRQRRAALRQAGMGCWW
ncbi:MAG: M48 family metallopeptidase [Thermodesulfobacteriota bacterium]